MRSRISSPTFVVAVVASITQPVFAHVRFTDVYGNHDTNAHGETIGRLSWIPTKDHGTWQYPGQWDVTVFSNPIIPASSWSPHKSFPRYWIDQTCGATLNSENIYYTANPHRDGEVWAPAKYDPHSQIMGDHRNYFFFMASIPVGAFLQTAAEVEQKAKENKMAMVTPGGWLEIKTWQVNDDGAGPFRCRIDETATGTRFGGWLKILQQPPGWEAHHSINTATNSQAHTLRVEIPANVKCKSKAGKYQNVCVMRCENYAPNGPFGGCIPFNVIYPKPQVNPPPKAQPIDTKTRPKPVKGNPGYDVSIKNTYNENKDGYGKGYKRKRGLEQKKARRENIASIAQLAEEED